MGMKELDGMGCKAHSPYWIGNHNVFSYGKFEALHNGPTFLTLMFPSCVLMGRQGSHCRQTVLNLQYYF